MRWKGQQQKSCIAELITLRHSDPQIPLAGCAGMNFL